MLHILYKFKQKGPMVHPNPTPQRLPTTARYIWRLNLNRKKEFIEVK